MATDKNSNKNKKATNSPTKKGSAKKASKENNKNTKGKGKKIFKRILFVFLFLCFAVFVVGLGYAFAVIKSAPPLDVNAIKKLSQPAAIFDNQGKLMDSWHSDVERNIVEFDEIPQELKDAYVSIEDQRFYKHSGIDIRRIAGSLVTDIKKIFTGEQGLHGGSTLTQQVLKNTILSNERSAVERKLRELYLAPKLEKVLSKDEILNQYLNTIPLGGLAYGVDAASNLYFGKSVSDLNLIESAYLAGMTQAPTYYSGYNEKNIKDPSRYINRTKTVLGKMKALGYITDEEYNQAVTDLEEGKLKFYPRKTSYVLDYEWYINPTVAQVKKDLKEKYKYSDEEVSNLLANGGLDIYTNMDRSLQDFTQDYLNNFTANNIGFQETYKEGTETPEFQASATIVDYRTGKVLAMVGGRGEQGANSLNRAYTDLRSIGSTTKPLTAYGPAINEHILTAGSTIDDSHVSAPNVNNDNKALDGNISLRDAIRRSKNVATTWVVENKVGYKTALSYGEKLGLIYSDKSKESPTLALGQFHNDPSDRDGGNTYILSSAFGIFGNSGAYTEPKLYSEVRDSSGNVLLETEVDQKQIFSPQAAYIMYDLLKGSAGYTGSSSKWGSMPVAGKTGTTSGPKDLWFAGVTPYLSASVWLGYDDQRDMPYGRSYAAAKAWGQIMKKAHEGLEVKDIQMPKGIVSAPVCIDSGMAPTELCYADPRGNRVYTELFIEGTEPKGLCEAHRLVKVNSETGKLANDTTPPNLVVEKVFVVKHKPDSSTADYPYLVPTVQDDYVALPSNEEDEEEKDKGDDEQNKNDSLLDKNDIGNNHKPNNNKKPENKR